MVGVRGFEPPAPASRRRCSTRLSYTPTGRRMALMRGAFIAPPGGNDKVVHGTGRAPGAGGPGPGLNRCARCRSR